MSSRIRMDSGFDGLVDEYVADALAVTETAASERHSVVAEWHDVSIEPLPRRRAPRASTDVLYRFKSIQDLLEETLASFAEEDAETDIDIVACPVIRRI